MNIRLILIGISFLLGILCIYRIRRYDIHEKEPFLKMFMVTVWGGLWSVTIALFLYDIVKDTGYTNFHNTIGALFVIGPVEELAKLLALFSAYFFIRKDLNEPTDGLLYMSCVALGFSLIENFFYATKAPNSEYLIFLRLLISTPGHILFSIFMGIAFYTVMKMHKGLSLLLFSFLYASFVHGIFDAIIFNGLYFIFLIILLRLAHSFALSLLNYSTAISPFRETIKDFVLNYSNPEKNKGLKCINCGSKEKKDTYKFDKIQIQKCDNCASYVTTRDSLYYIFHHFGSNFKNLTQYYKNNHIYKNKYSVLFAGNSIDEKSGLAYFNLDELGNALEDFNKKIIKEKEDKWWFPQLTA